MSFAKNPASLENELLALNKNVDVLEFKVSR
jgi:hypothetical protein